MTKLMRKHGKVIMSVLGVGLMVIFAIPTSMTGGSSHSRRPVGKIGSQVVYFDEQNLAASDWTTLKGISAMVPFLPSQYGYTSPEARPVPCVLMLGLGLARQIEANPQLYFLLQQEAKQRGIIASPDEVGTVIVNDLFLQDSNPDSPTPRGVRLSPDSVGGQDHYDQIAGAVARFLPVLTLVRELEASAKTTLPMWDHLEADKLQVRVAIVEFPADRFKTAVGLPTPEQMQAQYDKYKDVVPQPSADATTLNFGYKLPDRVRVQYLTIPRAKVLEAVRASRSAYDWKVDAAYYYQNHQDEFVGLPPETQPTTKPTTKPAVAAATTSPTTKPATVAATPPPAPTTRPFEEVQEKATLAVLAAPADDLTQKIQDAITARLKQDYLASTTGRTALSSKAYFDGVAVEIQKQFNVLPEVSQPGTWLDSAGLAKLPGIGTAFADNDTIASLAFPATQPAAGAAPSTSLATLQPSAPLKDPNSNVYIFRIVERDPSHTPPMKDVSVQVAADVQNAHMYQAALNAANALLAASAKHGLSAAAGLQNIPVITTPTAFAPFGEIPGYNASPQTTEILAPKIADLRKSASATNPQPISVIELPGEKKVLVVQLLELVSPLKPDIAYFMQLVSTRQEDAQMGEGVAGKYFSYDAVKARLHYVAEADKSGS